jgi:hypothetical protein
MREIDLKKLHELVKQDLLDFTPEFLKWIQIKSTKFEFQEIIRDIQTAICNKLNFETNQKFKEIPWNIISRKDIINWPEGIPLVGLSDQRWKHLRLLHKLRDVIFFSKEFLQRLSDPGFDNTPIGKLIISRHESQT